MAVISGLHSSADTTDGTSFTTAEMTPAAGNLLLAHVGSMASAAAAPTLVDSLGGTFALIAARTWNAAANSIYFFVGNQLEAATPRTLTFACPQDTSNGVIFKVNEVTLMTRTGASAVRQFKAQDGAAAATPETVFDAVSLAGNPLHSGLQKTSGTVATAPAGWTAMTTEQALATPTSTARSYKLDAGAAVTTITFGATVASAFGLIQAELDTSAPAASGAQRSKTLLGVG